jgi:predicted nucleotidyltransferase component of viral defense system
MDSSKVLTRLQKKFLQAFSKKQALSTQFYLTGGTALAGFYIPYRLSEDLDFFSEEEFNLQPIITFIKSQKKSIPYKSLDISTSFNRNLIFLESDDKSQLKTEFTYFPFKQINKPKLVKGLQIDTPLDIAVNKLFTIYQKPRSRDFMDLYMLTQKYGFNLEELIKKARIKFDWHIDYIQLGTQFLEAEKLKDYPNLLVELDENKWQGYFREEARKLKKKILK